MPRLVEALVQGRLLVAEDTGGRATITLGHEVLLAAWPALCEWLDRHRAQMQRLQRWLLSLEAPDASDRRRATEALGEIGSAEPEVVPALITVLDDVDKAVRSNIRPRCTILRAKAGLSKTDVLISLSGAEAMKREVDNHVTSAKPGKSHSGKPAAAIILFHSS